MKTIVMAVALPGAPSVLALGVVPVPEGVCAV